MSKKPYFDYEQTTLQWPPFVDNPDEALVYFVRAMELSRGITSLCNYFLANPSVRPIPTCALVHIWESYNAHACTTDVGTGCIMFGVC